jgi:hypothetical protein
MTRKRLTPIILAILIAAVLGGAYLIVAANGSPTVDVPSGFMH